MKLGVDLSLNLGVDLSGVDLSGGALTDVGGVSEESVQQQFSAAVAPRSLARAVQEPDRLSVWSHL